MSLPRTIYGKPNTDEVVIYIGEFDHQPQGFIEITQERPGKGYILNDLGHWERSESYLDELKEQKKEEIKQATDQAMRLILDDYPDSEVAIWYKQEELARKVLADPSFIPPMLVEIANRRDVSLNIIAQRIVQKAEEFSAFSGKVFGHRQKLRDSVDSAVDENELNNIEVDFTGI